MSDTRSFRPTARSPRQRTRKDAIWARHVFPLDLNLGSPKLNRFRFLHTYDFRSRFKRRFTCRSLDGGVTIAIPFAGRAGSFLFVRLVGAAETTHNELAPSFRRAIFYTSRLPFAKLEENYLAISERRLIAFRRSRFVRQFVSGRKTRDSIRRRRARGETRRHFSTYAPTAPSLTRATGRWKNFANCVSQFPLRIIHASRVVMHSVSTFSSALRARLAGCT